MAVSYGEAFKLGESGEKAQVSDALPRIDCSDIQRLELCEFKDVLISLEAQGGRETLKLL